MFRRREQFIKFVVWVVVLAMILTVVASLATFF